MVAAVRVVARGEALFGAGIAARMLQHFGRAATSSPFPELTERETEVVGLLAAGRDNVGVARRLGSAPRRCITTHPTSSPSCTSPTDPGAVLRTRDAGLGGTWVGLNYPCPLGVKKLECHHR
jgi:hypothetical protein